MFYTIYNYIIIILNKTIIKANKMPNYTHILIIILVVMCIFVSINIKESTNNELLK